jgi:RNA polymerase sigma factor (sigma-70 family)
MTIHTIVNVQEISDAELVARSLTGDRTAFGRIVSRYQTLICSLAYSRVGNLGESEDIAQETFITAWKHLRLLREPAKLRSWLCGIVRNRVYKTLRREGREPLHHAESLEFVSDTPADETLPSEQAVRADEEAILWRALERIRELYREPLILFYREHQSIEAVAAELELSEDAVKQRLARGRKLLHEEVTSFVEGALERSNPGKAFTLTVLATLPILSTSAKAATLGAAAVKGGAMVKGLTVTVLFNAVIGPLLGFVGPWIQYRTLLAAANRDEERKAILTYYRTLFALMVGFGLLLGTLIAFSSTAVNRHPAIFASALIVLVAGYVFAAARMGAWANRKFRELRKEQAAATGDRLSQPWEYRSRVELLGLPIIHIRFNSCATQRAPVKAWIAAGDFAFGLIFAFGGMAIAPVSIGGIAIGLTSFAGLALGVFTIGGFALGGWVFGGIAIGWQAFGGCALAWNAAMGGLALAREIAVGGVAHAIDANNGVATAFVKHSPFFSRMETLSHYLAWLNLLWLIPLAGWWRTLKNRPPLPDSRH